MYQQQCRCAVCCISDIQTWRGNCSRGCCGCLPNHVRGQVRVLWLGCCWWGSVAVVMVLWCCCWVLFARVELYTVDVYTSTSCPVLRCAQSYHVFSHVFSHTRTYPPTCIDEERITRTHIPIYKLTSTPTHLHIHPLTLKHTHTPHTHR